MILDSIDRSSRTGACQCIAPPSSGFADIAGYSCNAGDFHSGDQWSVVLAGLQDGGWFLCQRFLGGDWRGIAVQYYLVGLVHLVIQELNAITEEFQY